MPYYGDAGSSKIYGGKMGVGQLAKVGTQFLFKGSYEKGTTPTLLESEEAKKVKSFIEGLLYKCQYTIQTGARGPLSYGQAPSDPYIKFNFTDIDAPILEMYIPTSLFHDHTPVLGGSLETNGNLIYLNDPTFFITDSDYGFRIHPNNPYSDTDDNFRAQLMLATWEGDTQYLVGFKTPTRTNISGSSSLDADNKLVWTLPHEDGTSGQVLQTDGSRVLSFVDGGSGQNFGIISVAGQSDVEADQSKDTLTLIAGTGISLTTDAAADSVTITNTDYGGGSLTVKEQDGTPSVSNVTTIKFDNGTVTDDGSGVVSVTNSGGGGSFPITGAEDEIVTLDASGNPQRAADIKAIGGSGSSATKYFDFTDLNNAYDYRIGRVQTGTDQGITVDAGSGSIIADFFKTLAFAGGNYRTLSVGHDVHTFNGTHATAKVAENVLDVEGRITLRGADPDVDDNVYSQIRNPHTSGNSGILDLPSNAMEISHTNALGRTIDADGSNSEAKYFRTFRADGTISGVGAGFSTGIHFEADSGTTVSLGDGELIDIAGGTDISTSISTTSGLFGNVTHTIQAEYTGGTSDERLKENIQPLKGAAEKVAALRAVEFDWSDEKERERTGNVHDFGFVAQEVEQVIPELVRERSDGMKTVNYGGVVPLLLDVIQDLTKRIELLESKAQ